MNLFYSPNLLAMLEVLSGNRFVFSMFCLLAAILLIYFWIISKEKAKANHKDISGLVYLFTAYLLYSLLGLISLFEIYDSALKPVPSSYLIISGFISLSFLSAVPFFSIGSQKIDDLVSMTGWKTGLKYFAFAWVIIISLDSANRFNGLLQSGDLLISILCFTTFGFFITRYFWHRGLRFLALVSVIFFTAYLLLLIITPESIGPSKFTDINSYLLAPAGAMSAIVLSYTFNWINELNFYELSKIWVNDEDESTGGQQKSYAKLTVNKSKDTWMEKIADDKLEKVIEEIIILKKHKNENLEDILNIASRNTRNNNNQMKQIIKYEDYQLNRNQVSHSLIQLIRQ